MATALKHFLCLEHVSCFRKPGPGALSGSARPQVFLFLLEQRDMVGFELFV